MRVGYPGPTTFHPPQGVPEPGTLLPDLSLASQRRVGCGERTPGLTLGGCCGGCQRLSTAPVPPTTQPRYG